MKIKLQKRFNREKWNKLVLSSSMGKLYQTSQWAEFKYKCFNAQPYYLIAESDEDIPLGALLFFREGQDYTNHEFIKTIYKQITMHILPSYNWQYGPILFNNCIEQYELINKIIDKVCSYIDDSGGYSLSGLTVPLTNQLNYPKSKLYGTYQIDLSKDVNILWKNINKYARKNIKRCLLKGVVIKQAENISDVKEYWRVVNSLRANLNIGTKPFKEFRYMWNIFHKSHNYEIFLARYKGDTVAGVGVIHANKIINESIIGYLNQPEIHKLNAGDALKWAIIAWGIKNNMKCYDLSGFELNPTSEKQVNIKKFKSKWGGEINYYHEIIRDYTNFKNFPKIKRRILNIKRNIFQ